MTDEDYKRQLEYNKELHKKILKKIEELKKEYKLKNSVIDIILYKFFQAQAETHCNYAAYSIAILIERIQSKFDYTEEEIRAGVSELLQKKLLYHPYNDIYKIEWKVAGDIF